MVHGIRSISGAAIYRPGTPRWNADGTRLGTGISKHLDFWPLDIYNLLHPQQRVDEDQAEMYEYRGQTYTGVWRPASEVLLPKGALCKAHGEMAAKALENFQRCIGPSG